jgi:hypothetical protein
MRAGETICSMIIHTQCVTDMFAAPTLKTAPMVEPNVVPVVDEGSLKSTAAEHTLVKPRLQTPAPRSTCVECAS